MANRAPTFSLQRMTFLAVSLVLCIQVGWWINVQIRESGRLLEARSEALGASLAEAWQMDSLHLLISIGASPDPSSRTGSIQGQFATLPSLEQRRAAIQKRFPQVVVVPSAITSNDLALLDGAAFLSLRPEPLIELRNQRWHSVLRAASEGAFMVVAVLSGLVLLYRKLAEELDLKLRQRNFTSAITHELKTPIASLKVWTETLFSRTLSEDQWLRIRDLMEKDLARLDELVGNLLDVARAESGSLVLHLAPLELAPWLRAICEAMDSRLEPGALGLRLEFASEPLWANADPKALGTAIENLLSNAFKYAAEPRQTTVTLDGDGDDALIVVSDRGHGIAPRDLPRIFHRFFRAGDEMTRQVTGTGLGLFLVKEIVARHGGEVRASSRGLGLGSDFTVRLPRLPRPADA